MKSELCCLFFLGLMSSPAASCSQYVLKMSATQCLLLLHCSFINKLDTKPRLQNSGQEEDQGLIQQAV